MILDKNNLEDISQYLKDHQLVEAGDHVISADKPGEGNMNYVLRITLTSGSLIIKQARPFVEKYPNIAAPEERVIVEGAFYKKAASNNDLKDMMPSIKLVDELHHIIVLEDLGTSNDLTYLYQQQQALSVDEAKSLSYYLSVLHNSFKTKNVDELMSNRKLRALNHEHIFKYPLMVNNGFDLDTIQVGLQALSMPYKNNDLLHKKAAELGNSYLSDGDTLLHGDYYPGSWLQTEKGVTVIDPEFSFYGAAEFDLSVMIAHLKMAQQPSNILDTVIASYQKTETFDHDLFHEYIGIEIIRRIIGLAQLPLTLSLAEKEVLLQEALQLLQITQPSI